MNNYFINNTKNLDLKYWKNAVFPYCSVDNYQLNTTYV